MTAPRPAARLAAPQRQRVGACSATVTREGRDGRCYFDAIEDGYCRRHHPRARLAALLQSVETHRKNYIAARKRLRDYENNLTDAEKLALMGKI